jgi:hypothetical protein
MQQHCRSSYLFSEPLHLSRINACGRGGEGLTLVEALELTALVALKDPTPRSQFAGRWLIRLLSERPGTTLVDAAIVLAYLGGPRHA